MGDFVSVPFTQDATALADNAIEALRATWTDWEPNDGDPEVIIIEEVAPLAAAVAQAAAAMPDAAFRVLGTEIFGVPYQFGSPATTLVTLVMVDDAGYTVTAGAQLNIDGYAFQLVSDAVVPNGSSEITDVPVMATVDGSAQNNLTGAVTSSLTLPPYVTSIVVAAPTANGVDDEDDLAYQARVSRELVLRARTLANARDFAIQAMNNANVARAYATQDATRHLEITLVGTDGDAVSSDVKTEVLADYDTFAMQNLTWALSDATYNDVDVDVTVLASPGAAPSTVQSFVTAVLQAVLNPLTWGAASPLPTSLSPPDWVNTPTVSKNGLIGIVAGSQSAGANGIRLVESLTLTSSTSGAAVQPNGDLLMTGSVPLPRAGTINVTVIYP